MIRVQYVHKYSTLPNIRDHLCCDTGCKGLIVIIHIRYLILVPILFSILYFHYTIYIIRQIVNSMYSIMCSIIILLHIMRIYIAHYFHTQMARYVTIKKFLIYYNIQHIWNSITVVSSAHFIDAVNNDISMLSIKYQCTSTIIDYKLD